MNLRINFMMHPSESELPFTSFLGLYGNCSSKNIYMLMEWMYSCNIHLFKDIVRGRTHKKNIINVNVNVNIIVMYK